MCAFISCCLPNFFQTLVKLIFCRSFERWPTTWNFSTSPSTSMSSVFAGRQWHDGRVDGPDGQHNNIMDTGDRSKLSSLFKFNYFSHSWLLLSAEIRQAFLRLFNQLSDLLCPISSCRPCQRSTTTMECSTGPSSTFWYNLLLNIENHLYYMSQNTFKGMGY